MAVKKFTAKILSNESGGMYVIVPFDVEKEYGKKRVKIKAMIEGVEYRGSLVRMGTPDHILLMRKDVREKIGKTAGDIVSVAVEEDTTPRVVEVPKDFLKILKTEPEIHTFFKKMSYTHQKEYVNWIEEAKREETRIRRMNKALEMMKNGKKGV